MSLVFTDSSREALIISSHAALKPNFSTPSFSPCCLLILHYYFSLSSLHLTLSGFLSAGSLSDREGSVRCQIPELGDQRQTKRLVTYCSILKRQKNGFPHKPRQHIYPPFHPSSSFTHSIMALVFFPFCQSFPAPSLLSLS